MNIDHWDSESVRKKKHGENGWRLVIDGLDQTIKLKNESIPQLVLPLLDILLLLADHSQWCKNRSMFCGSRDLSWIGDPPTGTGSWGILRLAPVRKSDIEPVSFP